ncbi:MAG: peptide chain release factor N(5)-glutamine methyltransferase [Gaiellaceae bacterium]
MSEPLTLGEVLRRSSDYLEKKGVESARRDAERLLAHGLGCSRLELYTAFERLLSEAELALCRSLVERRGRREPLAYVLGEWDFRRLTLRCDARALVPRPETEVVVERALESIAGLDSPRVLDVGTGSGAIALAVAQEHPGARVTGIDVSADALALARENVELTGIPVELRRADLRDPLEGPFELVVCNPPYVEPAEIGTLEPEVRDWEPRQALVGSGIAELVASRARDLLVSGGWLVVELGLGQQQAYGELLRSLGYERITITPDLTGRERVVEGRWP